MTSMSLGTLATVQQRNRDWTGFSSKLTGWQFEHLALTEFNAEHSLPVLIGMLQTVAALDLPSVQLQGWKLTLKSGTSDLALRLTLIWGGNMSENKVGLCPNALITFHTSSQVGSLIRMMAGQGQ